MPTTFAVISDMHLSGVHNTAQAACLDWALGAIVDEQPDLLVVAGDVTADGSPEVAAAFRERVEGTRIPFLITQATLIDVRHRFVAGLIWNSEESSLSRTMSVWLSR